MTQINAYLGFNGNCREAMTFYKDCLGGELTLMPVEGSPVAEQMPVEARQGILHSCLTHGTLTLMATDMGEQGAGATGSRVALMLNCSSDEEITRLFSSLSAGGQVTCPLGGSFWGSKFGHFTDQFGTNWMLNYENSAKELG